MAEATRVLPVRLAPGTDLRLGLEQVLADQGEQAAWVLSGIGSLSVAPRRLAGQEELTILEGDLEIGMNDIGRLRLRATAPLFFDGYKRNRTTGSLILIDEFTNNTVAAGMILEPGGTEVSEDAYADMGGL